MKTWKCNNCARDKITEDNIVSVVCLCGDYYTEIKEEVEDEKE